MLAYLMLSAALAADDPFAVDADVFTLPNGLTVVLEENHRTDTVGLWIHYGVGARDELEGEFGCAHLFEHMMFEGSQNVPDTSFDDWLTAAGGDNNAYTSEDETAYFMKFPSGALDVGLFLESDRMAFLNAGLTQENLDNQQDVVLQERARGFDQPNGRDWDALAVLQYPGHGYGHSVIGTIDDVSTFEIEAVTGFWKKHYRPDNAVLGLVGNFDKAQARERVEFWFKDVPAVEAPERVQPEPYAYTAQYGLVEDKVEDRTLYLVWGTVPHGHADGPALDVASMVLSGGRGTRLSDALYYESKLAVDEFIYPYSMDREGVFVIGASTTKGSLKPIEKAIHKQVDSLVSSPASADELKRAKKAIRSGMLNEMEAPLDRVSQLVWCQRIYGKPDCLSEEWAKIDAVTAADVSRVIETYFIPERRTALSVVPMGGKGALKGSLPVELP